MRLEMDRVTHLITWPRCTRGGVWKRKTTTNIARFALIAYIDSLGFFGRDHANPGRICCKTNFRFMRQPTTFHLAHKSTTLVVG